MSDFENEIGSGLMEPPPSVSSSAVPKRRRLCGKTKDHSLVAIEPQEKVCFQCKQPGHLSKYFRGEPHDEKCRYGVQCYIDTCNQAGPDAIKEANDMWRHDQDAWRSAVQPFVGVSMFERKAAKEDLLIEFTRKYTDRYSDTKVVKHKALRTLATHILEEGRKGVSPEEATEEFNFIWGGMDEERKKAVRTSKGVDRIPVSDDDDDMLVEETGCRKGDEHGTRSGASGSGETLATFGCVLMEDCQVAVVQATMKARPKQHGLPTRLDVLLSFALGLPRRCAWFAQCYGATLAVTNRLVGSASFRGSFA